MIKLIKQGNQIVTYLKAFEVEDITDEYVSKSPLSVGFNQKDDKFQAMKDLVDDYLSKQQDLAEFEKEAIEGGMDPDEARNKGRKEYVIINYEPVSQINMFREE